MKKDLFATLITSACRTACRLLLCAVMLLPLAGWAATGNPDSFNPNPDSEVFAIAAQPDGKVLLGGDFTYLGAAFGENIARVSADGSRDVTFTAYASAAVDGHVVCTAVQPDGRILLGGYFTSVGSWPRTNLARVNADGTMDFSFSSPVVSPEVRAVAFQPDGKIVVGGLFRTVGGVVRIGVARLAANGTLETGFDANANGDVNSVVSQPDGKILLGGYFTSVGGWPRTNLARLNADATLDTGFDPSANGDVYCLALQADGKILVGGQFTSIAGTNRNHFARLNTDGTLDASFNPNASSDINTLAVQADGKIIAGGLFTNIAGAGRTFIARVLNDGVLDATFNPNITSGWVDGVALQSDGKVFVGGWFSSVGGQTRNYIARLENDAATQSLTASNSSRVEWLRGGTAPESHEVTFELSTNGGTWYTLLDPPARINGGWELKGLSLPIGGQLRARARVAGGAYCGSSGWVETVALFGFQPEIVVQGNGADIAAGDNTPSPSDGTDFGNVDLAIGGSVVHTFVITNSGNTNLILGGVTIGGTNAAEFTVTVPPVTDLAAGASTTFQVTFAPTAPGLRTATLSFTNNDANENPFTFSLQGTFNFVVDSNFNPNASHAVYNVVVQPDGKLVVGGDFVTMGGVVRFCLARLNPDGALDYSFKTNLPNATDRVRRLALQPDARLLIGGSFVALADGYLRRGLARLNSDGTTDPSFDASPNLGSPESVVLQRDGNILISGSWSSISGVPNTNEVARLNADGTIDNNFLANVSSAALSIAVQSDGKILLGGSFSTVNGLSRYGLVRLNADGTLDNGFNFGSTTNAYPLGPVTCVALQGDGKILFGGAFTSIAGGSGFGRGHIARLNPDGTLDLSFNPDANNWVNSIAVQANGKVLLGGEFSTLGGATRNHIARVNADGSLDSTFDPNANDQVRSVSLQADGRVLLAGDFTALGGLSRNHLARIVNESATQSLSVPDSSRIQWLRGGSSPESQLVSFEISTNGDGVYVPLGFGVRITGGWELTGLSLPARGQIRARAQTAGGFQNNACGYVEALTFFPTNAAPLVANPIPDQTATEDLPFTFTFDANTFSDADPGNVFTYTATNLPAWLTFTPATRTFAGTPGDANVGAVDITVVATDSGLPPASVSDTFRITVNSVNNVPVFTKGPDVSSIGTTNAQTFVGWATGISDGDATVTQSLTFNVTNNNPGLFTMAPSVAANGTLTYTPNGNIGFATVGVSLTDDATAGGPALTSAVQTFIITALGSQLAVLGNHVTITNGGSSTSLADHTDFGSVAFSTTLVRTFTITNSGTAPLAVGSVTVSGTGAADFSVTTQPATTVATNGSTIFQVAFSPSVLGLRSASLAFTNNDLSASSFNFAIQATGIASSNANLAALTLSRGTLSPVFAAVTTNYTASVAYADTNLSVTATRAQTNATLELQLNGAGYVPLTSGSPSAQLALTVGANIVNVRVTAQDGATVKTYTVTVTRRLVGELDSLDLALGGSSSRLVNATTVQPDGKIIIAGNFNSILGVARTNVVRLNADGTVDMGFNPNPNGTIYGVAVQTDGKVVLGGSFSTIQPNGAPLPTTRNNLARVNADGSLDVGFDPSPNGSILGLAVQLDGKVLLGGGFTTFQPNNGVVTNRNRAARLNADGTLDPGFIPNANNSVWTVAVQEDGKVLLGGDFTSLQPNGAAVTNRNRLARLNADGTLDAGFNPNPNSTVYSLAQQPDGKVLLSGNFTTLQPNGAASATNRKFIARINADGTLDLGFDPSAANSVTCLALQVDGQVLLGGRFGSLQPNGGASTVRNYAARVKADGTLDMGFDPKPNNNVLSVTLQADGKVLLGGVFDTLQPNGAPSPTPRSRFARLLNDPATQSLTTLGASEVSWTRGGSSPEVSQVTFELSTDGGANWTPLGNGIRVGTTADWQLTGLALPASGQLRARGRTTSVGFSSYSSGVIESVASFGTEVVSPPFIASAIVLGNGAFQFAFSNANNVAFNVLAATDINQPASNWTVLGLATNLGGGLYQFTDPQATNYPIRFYRLRYP